MPDQNGFATMDEEDRSWAELTKRYRRVEHHAMHARKQFPETCSACWREANPATDSPSVLDSAIDIEGAEAGWTGAPDPASEGVASVVDDLPNTRSLTDQTPSETLSPALSPEGVVPTAGDAPSGVSAPASEPEAS